MKRLVFLLLILCTVAGEAQTKKVYKKRKWPVCRGYEKCYACKNCKSCKRCNQGGGTCGVCHRKTKDFNDRDTSFFR